MDKKRKLNIYKGCRRDIKINSDIYLVRNVKERSSDEEFTDKSASADIIFEKTKDTVQNINEPVAGTATKASTIKSCDGLITINTITIDENVKKDNVKEEVEPVIEPNKRIEPQLANKVFLNVNYNKKNINQAHNEIIIDDTSFDEFKSNELCSSSIQTKNERDALESSSLFSLNEKKLLRVNSYTPVLVDTLLLEKLVRLDKNIARKLIFKIFKQLDEVILPSEEIVQAPFFAEGIMENIDEMDFTAIIKSKEKKTQKKISVKRFLINQMYHLLHSRMTRNKERPAELLYYLILKSAFKKNPTETENNPDLKRIKEKIKEYAAARHEKLKNKKAKQRKKNAMKNSEEELKGKKIKKNTKKKQKKTKLTDENVAAKRSDSVLRSNRRNALAHKLLKVHKGMVVDKEKLERATTDYLTKQGHMLPPLLSDGPDTSSTSSDLS